MSDETYREPSILDEDLSSVDTSFPVIKGGIIHDFEVKHLEVQDNKEGTGQNLVITLTTTGPVPGLNGQTIDAGFPVYHYVGLTPIVGRPDKRDYNEDQIRRSLAQFTLAVHGKKLPVNPFDAHLGKRVRCKVAVTKPTAEYPNPGNKLTFVLP